MRIVSVAGMLALAALLVAGVHPVAAEDKAKDLIVGKWEMSKDGQKGTLEFLKDGKLTIKIMVQGNTIDLEGKYKFVDDTNLEFEISFMGETKKEKSKVGISKEELTLENPQGKKETFKRVK